MGGEGVRETYLTCLLKCHHIVAVVCPAIRQTTSQLMPNVLPSQSEHKGKARYLPCGSVRSVLKSLSPLHCTENDSQPDCSCLLRQCSICYGELAFQFE